MLQNAYFLAKIGADTAENEQHFAEILPIGRRVADRPRRAGGKEIQHLTASARCWQRYCLDFQTPAAGFPLRGSIFGSIRSDQRVVQLENND